jgi:hypothetical protein
VNENPPLAPEPPLKNPGVGTPPPPPPPPPVHKVSIISMVQIPSAFSQSKVLSGPPCGAQLLVKGAEPVVMFVAVK